MSYLLDTCIISEFAARQPSVSVLHWLVGQMEERMHLSAITIGELKYGVERLPLTERRARLEQWLEIDVLARFQSRILPVDTLVMLRWGALKAHLERIGRPMQPMDSLIAATALAHNLILVTRNTGDFGDAGVQLFNPWQETADTQ
ncbi:MAG: type II toxin-antitoxin system VapC family toxin [Caldilineaceae bacterium]|nr:type II toxin-antitoxin system VapC family toxin [Caldilineaceae bacterium]